MKNVTSRSYVINVPLELANEISRIARKNEVLEIEVLRKFVKVGLLAANDQLYLIVDEQFEALDLFDPKPEVAPVTA